MVSSFFPATFVPAVPSATGFLAVAESDAVEDWPASCGVGVRAALMRGEGKDEFDVQAERASIDMTAHEPRKVTGLRVRTTKYKTNSRSVSSLTSV